MTEPTSEPTDADVETRSQESVIRRMLPADVYADLTRQRADDAARATRPTGDPR